MTRPTEYENLIKTKALESVAPTAGAIQLYLQNARDYLVTAKATDPQRSLQVFTLAYEGYFQLVQAVLEFHEVRTKDAGRNLAIQRVSADLKLSAGEFGKVHSSGVQSHEPTQSMTRSEMHATFPVRLAL